MKKKYLNSPKHKITECDTMITAIIQARMGSSRMPGKTMKKIAGRPLLYYSISRVKAAKKIDTVLVATTDLPKDDEITEWCQQNKIPFYRGSESDVLDRYYQSAKQSGASIIVRITSDCPFVDPDIIDMLIEKILTTGADYVSNRVTRRTWPHGLDIEVFSFQALEKAWSEAISSRDREHVTPFIWEHPERFSLVEVPLIGENFAHIRLTVDFPEDFLLVQRMVEKFQAHTLPWREIIKVLFDNPELMEINSSRANSTM